MVKYILPKAKMRNFFFFSITLFYRAVDLFVMMGLWVILETITDNEDAHRMPKMFLM